MSSLVIGKLIGITGFWWLAIKIELTSLAAGVNVKHFIAVGFMGGHRFVNQNEALLMAKRLF